MNKKIVFCGLVAAVVISAIAAQVLTTDANFGGSTRFFSPSKYQVSVEALDDAILKIDFINKPTSTYTNYSNPIYFSRTGFSAQVSIAATNGTSYIDFTDPTQIVVRTNLNLASVAASKILQTGTDHNIIPLTVGSGLTFDGITLSASGSGAPTTAQYVTLATDGTLSAERVLTGTANQISVTDGGAGGNVTLATPQNIHTAATPQFSRIGLGVAADGTVPLNLWEAIATGTSTAGTAISNTTVATVGAQAQSPWYEMDGNGWKTTATAGSQPVGARIGAIPVQAATSPTVIYRIQTMTNNGSWKTIADFSADNGQTNTGQFLNIGGGMLFTGPAGTSSSIVNAGANQLRLTGVTTVSMALGGVDVINLTSGQFAADSAADGAVILGTSSTRWRQIWHLNNRALTGNQTTTSASLASTTLTTASLPGTWRYHFSMVLYVNNSTAADGISIDFNGGTATMTQFRADVQMYDSTGLLKSAQTTALATAISTATITGDGSVKADISFIPNTGGTVIPRFAVNNHTTGTLTVYKDSCLICTDMVP